jgi:succinyl-CoA synthetase alpha subunit
MSILADEETRVVVQGITGRQGEFHTEHMLAYGTEIVAGVTPGKGGQWVHGVPVFNTVKKAVEAKGANCAVIFVPARFAPDAIYEAADAGIPLVICLTEGIPVLDMIRVRSYLNRKGCRLIGPNCPGLITPLSDTEGTKVGIIPADIVRPGPVGVVSRSGTLTYEVIYALSQRDVGQSTCVGIGGDPINGTSFIDVLQMFEEDPYTEQVIMIGEIGGSYEEQLAEAITQQDTKLPVVALVSGLFAQELPGEELDSGVELLVEESYMAFMQFLMHLLPVFPRSFIVIVLVFLVRSFRFFLEFGCVGKLPVFLFQHGVIFIGIPGRLETGFQVFGIGTFTRLGVGVGAEIALFRTTFLAGLLFICFLNSIL